jgi:hypothetical protein
MVEEVQGGYHHILFMLCGKNNFLLCVIKMVKLVKLKLSIELYSSGKLQTGKSRFVSISNGYIYISRDINRSYWNFRKMGEPYKYGRFSDRNMSLKVANNLIVFHKRTEYKFAKDCLQKYFFKRTDVQKLQ